MLERIHKNSILNSKVYLSNHGVFLIIFNCFPITCTNFFINKSKQSESFEIFDDQKLKSNFLTENSNNDIKELDENDLEKIFEDLFYISSNFNKKRK